MYISVFGKRELYKFKGTVIGKILRTDGTAVEFYKDENGRIKQR